MTGDNITSGFRACVIYPVNPAEIPQEAYLPNALFAVDTISADMTDDTVPVTVSASINDTADNESDIPGIVYAADGEKCNIF